VPARALRIGDLRRLIDVIDTTPQSQSTNDGAAVNGSLDWERVVDPLRLYCTSTRHQPPGWAWAPPTIGQKAVRAVRDHGVRSLITRSLAYASRRLPVPRLEKPWRNGSGPGVSLPADLAARLTTATTLADFHRIASEHQLLGDNPRFMDLEIDVSNKCNIRCKMCYFSFERTFHAKPVFMPPGMFERLGDTILPHAKAVMLSLGSEPLTSPHFVSILRMTARHQVPEVGFYTNGLLMTDRLVEAVLEHRVTLIAISVDGATKKTFESIRRGADFDVLLNNVRRLVRRRAETGGRLPRLRFGVVMMRQNIEELPDIVTLAWRLGVEELNFFHTVIYEGLDMAGQSLVEHKALSNRYLAQAQARARELGVTIVHNPNPFQLGGGGPQPERSSVPSPQTGPYCRFPFFHVSISAEGKVLPCPFSHGEAAYGIVGPEMPFERIWLGSAFTELRERILTNQPPDMCRRCSFLASSHPDVAELFAARRN
jgi:MoaA/NifB/PqqE/SkfB family radical SAM enzyme